MSLFIEQFSLGKKGPRVAVKDCIDVAGYASKAGSESLADAPVANSHAEVVERLLSGGCELIGKLNMHEFAYGMSGVNHYTGTPINPLFPNYIPGGSSSASAALVAQGGADFTLGSDTGGSIRLPAACCGVYGLKPTFGRVSRKGALPEHTTLDCVGPFANSVQGLILAMSMIDDSFKWSAGGKVEAFTLGRVRVEAHPDIEDALSAYLDNASVPCQAIELPSIDAAFKAGLDIINAECWAAWGEYLASDKVGKDVATRLRAAKNTTPAMVVDAEDVRQRFTAEVNAALENVSVLVLPTLPDFPMARDAALAGAMDLRSSALVRPFNLSGHPALSVPIKDKLGRPMAMQLVAAHGQDERLCEVAAELERLQLSHLAGDPLATKI